MRPTRLSLSGFTAFRDDTEIDFTAADLFAFTGATGSGKSSIVDAIVFALYGSVPRLDRRAVAPVVSLGRYEAKVRLDFTVGGEAYTVARVVRRTKGGATTKEARLQRADGEILAGNAEEITGAVEQLLGLGFEHFTTCVVLPQGEFARFLHAADKERQTLLVKLLDFGLYRLMASLANEREQQARRRADVSQTLLAKLAFATPRALEHAARRLAELTLVRDEITEAVPMLDKLRLAGQEASTEAAQARQEDEILAGVAMPAGVAGLGAALAKARGARDQADAEVDRLATEADTAEAALSALPKRSALERARDLHEQRSDLVAQQAKGERLLADRIEVSDRTSGALAAAEEVVMQAADHRDRVLWEHRAHDLMATLAVGKPCPVCAQVVAALPPTTPGEGVDEARAALHEAEAGRKEAGQRAAQAERATSEIEAKLGSISERLVSLEAAVTDQPGAGDIDRQLAEVTAAERAERTAREALGSANRAAVAARKAVGAHEAAELAARRAFDQARDRVAALGPPPAERHDLVADWEALSAWAGAERPMRAERASGAEVRAAELRDERAAALSAMVDRCRALDVPVGDPEDLRAAVGDAVAAASAEQARLDCALADAAGHRVDLERHTRSADTAHELGRLLSVRHFEKWVLDETLAGLVAGATELLLDLSGGAYSLALDERSSFNVVDHRNADEVRSARTLSGGETFLASLALALALADQIGSLAAGGSARLESIFLDEGFGTLDSDTLDTVAAAIEELGARGRTVGLISHVPELAERVPVRFQVTKGPGGSTVERVAQ